MEGERVGEGKRHSDGEIHCGAEQTSVPGWGCPFHIDYQQCHGVRLPLSIQLHCLELFWTWNHDHYTRGERYAGTYTVQYSLHTYLHPSMSVVGGGP